jgi:phage/plasmid-associated DNA primase
MTDLPIPGMPTQKIGLKSLELATRASVQEDDPEGIIGRAYTHSKSADYIKMMEFLNGSPQFASNKGTDETQIFTLDGGWYVLPTPVDQATFFSYYEKCRITGMQLRLVERQDINYSSIYIDLDFVQSSPTRIIEEMDYDALCRMAGEILVSMFDLYPLFSTEPLYIAFQMKPAVVPKNSKKYDLYKTDTIKNIYGDGIHMFILSTMISRAAKKYFMNRFRERVGTYFGSRYLNSNSIVDQGSAYVPVFLYGSTRDDRPPYHHCGMWQVFPPQHEGGTVTASKRPKIFQKCARSCAQQIKHGDNEDNDMDPDYGIASFGEISVAHEYSVNFARDRHMYGIVPKFRVDPREEMLDAISKYESHAREGKSSQKDDNSSEGITREARVYSEVDQLCSKNAEAKFIRQLIDIMSPLRSREYQLWIRVVWAIANTNVKYKCLAEYFSRKTPELFKADEFDEIWERAVSKAEENSETGYRKISLQHWAKEDSPQKYDIILRKDIETSISRNVFERNKMGTFSQFDIAELIDTLLGDRYAIDIEEGGGKHLVVYEFVMPEDKMSYRPGEPYKWRIIKDLSYLQVFISRVIGSHMENVYSLVNAKTQKDDDEDSKEKVKARLKWYATVLRNLRGTINNLGKDSFKNGCLSQFKHIVHMRTSGFSATLNKDPHLLGVGNGVVVLKPDGTHSFVQGVHPHKISQFTTTEYVPFDPTHPLTKRLLYITRETQPDHTPDTHEWLMCAAASAVDGTVKDPYFIIAFGDGSNAKSLFAELQRNTLGDTYAVVLPVGSLSSKATGGQANPDLYMLLHARWAAFSESDTMQKVNTALVKHLTGQEHMALRGLFKDMINIKPKAVYFLTTNHLIELSDTTYGAFRRFKIVPFPMQFCIDMDDYDPANPYHRIADKSLTKEFINRPDVRARWLSILLWYRERFYKKYGGTLANVPHPNIIMATNDYRSTQDKINLFINARGVITKKVKRQAVIDVAELYVQWHISNVDSSADIPKLKNGLQQKFMGSVVHKYIIKDPSGAYVFSGFRFLKSDEKPSKGETMYYTKSDLKTEVENANDDDEDDEVTSNSGGEDDVDKKKSKPSKSRKNKKKKSKDDEDANEEEMPNVAEVLVAATMVDSDTAVIPESRKELYDQPYDKKTEGEKFKKDIEGSKKAIDQIKPETADQFYARIVREWQATQEQPDVPVPETHNELIEIENEAMEAQRKKEYKERLEKMIQSTNIAASTKGFDIRPRRSNRPYESETKVDTSCMEGMNDFGGDSDSGSDTDDYEIDIAMRHSKGVKVKLKDKGDGEKSKKSKKSKKKSEKKTEDSDDDD